MVTEYRACKVKCWYSDSDGPNSKKTCHIPDSAEHIETTHYSDRIVISYLFPIPE